MIKYKVVNEENEILFNALDTYQLIKKNDALIGNKECDIGKIKIIWAMLGMFISNVIIK